MKAKKLGKEYSVFRFQHKETGEFWCKSNGRLNSIFTKHAVTQTLHHYGSSLLSEYELVEYGLKEKSRTSVKRIVLLKEV